jgi:hypothetical protein
MHNDICHGGELFFNSFFDAVGDVMRILRRHIPVNENVEVKICGIYRPSRPDVVSSPNSFYVTDELPYGSMVYTGCVNQDI